MAYYAYRSTRRPSQRRPGGSRQPARGKRRGQYIDPLKFIKAATPQAQAAYQPMYRFADFAVNDLLKANLAAKGFVEPTPIQDQTIPLALDGSDIIGIANTGTGKTAAFALPILHQLMTYSDAYALVVAPTRELAQQIEAEMKALARGSGLHGALLIGGSPMGPQLRDLRYKPRIVIGTPGRIKDHLERGSLSLADYNIAVLDEVDRMLDMGFLPDVRFILGRLAPSRQSFFFSATLSPAIRSLIDSFADNPAVVSIKTGETSDNVHQDVIRFNGTNEKIDLLHSLLNDEDVSKVIIFDETKRSVERLEKELSLRGFQTDAIHGGKNQGQRQRALRRFKLDEINILVATDVAARGIDVTGVTHVINYSVPQTYDDYVHRIGRAGRAGNVGYALTFIAG